AFEDEPLDIRRQVGMGLVPVSARHLDQHEAAATRLVLVGELAAELFDARDRELDELREEAGLHRIRRRHDDGFDDATRFVLAQSRGGLFERIVVHGYSGSEVTDWRSSRAASGCSPTGSSHSARLAASRAVSPSRRRRMRRSPNVSNCSKSTTPCLYSSRT